MKLTRLIALAALITFSSMASEFDDTFKLAEQGDAKAQYKLAVMHFNGKGTSRDDKKAVKWLTKAAEQGVGEAQYFLAVMHYDGKGTPQDYKKSYIWFSISASNGYKDAIDTRHLPAEKSPPKTLKILEEAHKIYEKISNTKDNS